MVGPAQDNASPSTSNDRRGKRSSPCGKATAKLSKIQPESMEETPVYVISGNHGLITYVCHWNGHGLLQLNCHWQDSQGETRQVVVTIENNELDTMEQDIRKAKDLWIEHNARTKEPTCRLLFQMLSMVNSSHNCHLEVNRWQGYVRVSVQQFLVSDRGCLFLTQDRINFNPEQLPILRCHIPLVRDDYSMAANCASQTIYHTYLMDYHCGQHMAWLPKGTSCFPKLCQWPGTNNQHIADVIPAHVLAPRGNLLFSRCTICGLAPTCIYTHSIPLTAA